MITAVRPGCQYRRLPRGGLAVAVDSRLNLQIGVPPETIKDTQDPLCWPNGVPRHFMVPPRLFNYTSLTTMAELEFPGYYHSFQKGGKLPVHVYCPDRGLLDYLEVMTAEGLLGPEESSLAQFDRDFADRTHLFPIRRELDHFAVYTTEQVFKFHLPDEDGFFKLDGLEDIRLKVEQEGSPAQFVLIDGRCEIFRCSELDLLAPPPAVSRGAAAPRPAFALAALGNSTGFDVGGDSSGFMLWLDGRGVLVDPPANTGRLLDRFRVLPEEVTRIILTHCHADHDAGVLQRILEGSDIEIATTPTVRESFLRKYGRFLEQFSGRCRWHQVQVDREVELWGGLFHFFYGLHSVPALGFTVQLHGRQLFFSGDTRYDPPLVKKLAEEGVLTPQRADFLLDGVAAMFAASDAVVHEAGGGPLHTRPEEFHHVEIGLRNRFYLYHAPQQFQNRPGGSVVPGMQWLRPGVDTADMVVLDGREPMPADPDEEFRRHCLVFRMMDRVAGDLVAAASRIVRFLPGSRLYEAGRSAGEGDSAEDYVYLIFSGTAGVIWRGQQIKQYTKYDFVGEAELFAKAGRERVADVIARTELVCYAVPNGLFERAAAAVRECFERLAENREWAVENAIERSFLTGGLSWRGKTDLQRCGCYRSWSAGEQLLDEEQDAVIVLIEGEVLVGNSGDGEIFPYRNEYGIIADHLLPTATGKLTVLSPRAAGLVVAGKDYRRLLGEHGLMRMRWLFLREQLPQLFDRYFQ